MDTVTVSPKYQVVIPKAVRDAAELTPGQKLTVMLRDGVICLVPVPTLDELQGIAAGANVEGLREKADRL